MSKFKPNRDVDKNGNTNEVRANRATQALLEYKAEGGYPDSDSNEDCLADLLCDLMHVCDRDELDFSEAMRSAELNYEAEK